MTRFLPPGERRRLSNRRLLVSDSSRTCFPANARLKCDPAWGHGHVLGEGQQTPPCHYAATERVGERTYALATLRRVTAKYDVLEILQD